MELILTVILTAVLSAGVTLGTAFYLFRRYFWPDFQREVDAKLEEVGDALEERVRQGVRLGVVEGVRDIATGEVLKGTTEQMVRTGAKLVDESLSTLEQGLNTIFGPRGR